MVSMKNPCAVAFLSALAASVAEADMAFDDFSGSVLSLSATATSDNLSNTSSWQSGIAPIAGLDRRRWVGATRTVTPLPGRGEDGARPPGNDLASGNGTVSAGGGSALLSLGIYTGDDQWEQSVSSTLEYRALSGQSFDLSGFRSLRLDGIGGVGYSQAYAFFRATIVSAGGTAVFSLNTDMGGMGPFEINLWSGVGGSFDPSAIYSISLNAWGSNAYYTTAFGQPQSGGLSFDYSISSIQLIVPTPGTVAALGATVSLRRRRR